ncbi:lipoyl synthase [Bacteroidales bacterium OttesenSCG-928-L03]|nr:lipoyl synthase [Bacteroidales bacterium OttesenSCG-928-L03]
MTEPRKPDWLKVSLRNNDNFSLTGATVRRQALHTICQSGRCPNLGECWNRKTATFMVGGEICTRSCKFCNTLTGKPLPLDPKEPLRVAESIRSLEIRHAVITSVDRDDLTDYGSSHWAETIRTIKELNPGITMEVLIPDFRGDREALDRVIREQPDIISHNLETVRRLTPAVRSVAQYRTSLDVLRQIAESGIPAKSGLMLGLGEQAEEVLETLDDLIAVGCRLLSIGQYLRPSKKNLPVAEYVSPVRFAEYKARALEKGFVHVESGPFVRSSYRSVDYLRPN